MTTEQYQRIIETYINTRSLRKTAERTKHSFRLVQRVVQQGDGPGRPSAYEVLEEQAELERARLARHASQVGRFARGVYQRLLAKAGAQLAELEISLGAVEDARSLREATAALRELTALGRELYGGPEAQALRVTVEPSSGLDAEGVRAIAQDFQRRYPLAFSVENRSKTIGAIAAVQAARLAELPQERDDEEEAAGDPSGRV